MNPFLSRRAFIQYLTSTGLLVACGGEAISPRKKAKPRYLIVGAGPAALAAAITLLEDSKGAVDVDLVWQGHFVGGKASSWREEEYLVGHGFHVIFGFYETMRGMLKRAGVDESANFVSNGGRLLFYEERDKALHKLQIERGTQFDSLQAYTGFTDSEKSDILNWTLLNARTIFEIDQHPELDDEPFRRWALRSGLPASLVDTNFFRFARDAVFNYPDEISTFVVLKFMRQLTSLSFESFEFFYPAGDMLESFILPLSAYFKRLGGHMTPYLKATGLRYEGSRITGVVLAEPNPPPSHPNTGQWPGGIVTTKPDSEIVLTGYDGYVVAIPHESFLELNAGDRDFWSEPAFARVHRLQAAPTLSCRFWCREPVGTELLDAHVNGMPQPVATVADYKGLLPRYRDSRWASVLDTCGPLRGLESMDDPTLIAHIGSQIGSVAGFRNPMDCDPEHVFLRRNDGLHGRLLLPVPGHLAFKPTVQTAFTNMVLAGDWVRNSLEIPSMEGAMRAGVAAAKKLLK